MLHAMRLGFCHVTGNRDSLSQEWGEGITDNSQLLQAGSFFPFGKEELNLPADLVT